MFVSLKIPLTVTKKRGLLWNNMGFNETSSSLRNSQQTTQMRQRHSQLDALATVYIQHAHVSRQRTRLLATYIAHWCNHFVGDICSSAFLFSFFQIETTCSCEWACQIRNVFIYWLRQSGIRPGNRAATADSLEPVSKLFSGAHKAGLRRTETTRRQRIKSYLDRRLASKARHGFRFFRYWLSEATRPLAWAQTRTPRCSRWYPQPGSLFDTPVTDGHNMTSVHACVVQSEKNTSTCMHITLLSLTNGRLPLITSQSMIIKPIVS